MFNFYKSDGGALFFQIEISKTVKCKAGKDSKLCSRKHKQLSFAVLSVFSHVSIRKSFDTFSYNAEKAQHVVMCFGLLQTFVCLYWRGWMDQQFWVKH